MSFTFTTHYCGGEAVKSSISLGNVDLDCGMHSEKLNPCLVGNEASHFAKKGCCKNEFSVLALENDYSKSQSSAVQLVAMLALEPAEFIEVDYPVFSVQKEAANWCYKPPNLVHNWPVLYQVFRI